jgi:hypothetical protein
MDIDMILKQKDKKNKITKNVKWEFLQTIIDTKTTKSTRFPQPK